MKFRIVPVTAALIVGLGIVGASLVVAQSPSNNMTSSMIPVYSAEKINDFNKKYPHPKCTTICSSPSASPSATMPSETVSPSVSNSVVPLSSTTTESSATSSAIPVNNVTANGDSLPVTGASVAIIVCVGIAFLILGIFVLFMISNKKRRAIMFTGDVD